MTVDGSAIMGASAASYKQAFTKEIFDAVGIPQEYQDWEVQNSDNPPSEILTLLRRDLGFLTWKQLLTTTSIDRCLLIILSTRK